MKQIKKIIKLSSAGIISIYCMCVVGILWKFNSAWSHWYAAHSNGIEVSYVVNSVATLIYFFGGITTYLIALCGLLVSYTMVRRSFASTWDRCCAVMLLIPLSASYMAWYVVDLAVGFVPGGVIGTSLITWLRISLGFLNAYVILHALIIACSVIICAEALLFSAACVIYALHKIALFIIDYKILECVTYYIMRTCNVLVYRPLKASTYFIYESISGRVFEKARMTVPDDYEQYMQEVRALHQMLLLQKKQETATPPLAFSPTLQHKEKLPIAEPFIKETEVDAAATNNVYTMPSIELFERGVAVIADDVVKKELQERAQLLQQKLERFGVHGSIVDIKRGPVVTLFEYQPNIDTKLSKIVTLEDDLAMALQALSIRIIAPIPGKSVVGFEVANNEHQPVYFSTMFGSSQYQKFSGSLPLILGQDTIGTQVVADLVRMPHLLIAGSTGSGKSIALNGMLLSLLCKCSPDQLRLILIDPKRLEFMSYADIPHLLFPIITQAKQVANILRWVIEHMDQRYQTMAEKGVRNILEFNGAVSKAERMPFLVIVIDELSDLMLTVGKDIEDMITRIAQMARAAGIHMVVATQRPSVDVITGLIKANFPSRIAFRVTSRIDSRTILDANGADKLLGRGDMLFLDAANSQLKRIHGSFVSSAEIERAVLHIRKYGPPQYQELPHYSQTSTDTVADVDNDLYNEVVQFIKETDYVSISLLQRKFRIGYNRSARVIELLESHGLIMPPDGSKLRKVIR